MSKIDAAQLLVDISVLDTVIGAPRTTALYPREGKYSPAIGQDYHPPQNSDFVEYIKNSLLIEERNMNVLEKTVLRSLYDSLKQLEKTKPTPPANRVPNNDPPQSPAPPMSSVEGNSGLQQLLTSSVQDPAETTIVISGSKSSTYLYYDDARISYIKKAWLRGNADQSAASSPCRPSVPVANGKPRKHRKRDVMEVTDTVLAILEFLIRKYVETNTQSLQQ